MATANTSLDVTELSYDPNREQLKAFLRQQNRLKDYNFDGSTVGLLLDVLAYTSYGLGFYANMSANEGFLDSAVKRDSVVSRAKALGYLPRSAKGARATLRTIITPNDSPTSIYIQKGTRFEASLDGRSYPFETVRDYVVYPNADDEYIVDLVVIQGVTTVERTDVIVGQQQRYQLFNRNVDTDTLTVGVKPSAASTSIDYYDLAMDITEITGEDKSFFLEGDDEEKYVILFGDDVVGRRLRPGEQVVASYLVTDGSVANGINRFRSVAALGGYTSYLFTVTAPAQGGQDAEDIESIRFHAPLYRELQNRCVTSGDYKEYILAHHSDIEALTVWGGEDNEPPVYGRCFIAAKPYNGYVLTQAKKDTIFRSIDALNVQSIEPIFVDATFLYVVPSVRVFYDNVRTTSDAATIYAKIATAVATFERKHLGNFEQRFRYADFVQYLMRSDTAITNIEVDTKIQKRFNPILNSRFTYNLKFNHILSHPVENNPVTVISSTGFTLPAYAQTMYLDDDGAGKLRIYYLNGGARVYISRDAGTVDYDTGLVQIKNLIVSSYEGSQIKVTATPRYQSFVPVRNQIILLTDTLVAVWRETADRAERAAYTDRPLTQGSAEFIFDTALRR